MQFTEDKVINIDDLKIGCICYLEYESNDDIIIEKAKKVNDIEFKILKNGKTVKDYITIYNIEGDMGE